MENIIDDMSTQLVYKVDYKVSGSKISNKLIWT